MQEQLLSLDPVRINFSTGGMHLVNIILAFVMFGVALGIRPAMFREILAKPKSFVIGIFSQLVVLPAVTFLLIIVFDRWITPFVAMGMILVASCPGGNISNFITSLSKGNTELSISLTAVTTLSATITTPFNFAFWGGLYARFVNNHAGDALMVLKIDFYQMFEAVFILLGIPLAFGMLLTYFYPSVSEKLKKPIQYFSFVFFFFMVAVSFWNNFDLFVKYISFIFLIVFIHNLCALSTGYGLGKIFGLEPADRKTLAIETGIQNSGLGLVLLFNPKIFPPELQNGGMLFVTAWWAIWHIISGIAVAYIFLCRSRLKMIV